MCAPYTQPLGGGGEPPRQPEGEEVIETENQQLALTARRQKEPGYGEIQNGSAPPCMYHIGGRRKEGGNRRARRIEWRYRRGGH